jgi:hypothetical protein
VHLISGIAHSMYQGPCFVWYLSVDVNVVACRASNTVSFVARHEKLVVRGWQASYFASPEPCIRHLTCALTVNWGEMVL